MSTHQDAGFAVVNPATGELVKEYPAHSDEELRDAMGRAHAAHGTWGTPDRLEERVALMRRVGELHVEHRDRLADIIVREMGKTKTRALGEVDFSASIYAYYADRAAELLADEPIDLLSGTGSAYVRRGSLGALLGIMPWNYPYYQVARFAAPNLVVGNTVLLKHAPQCPESAAAIEELFVEAGFPDGAYVNVYASNDQVGSLIADPRLRGVSLTGSERAGAAVAEIAGRHLKKVVLELGGSDPFVLLGTDDLDASVAAAVDGRLYNAGQSCNAPKRFIVIDELYEAFVEKFAAAMSAIEAGDPTSTETLLGPLSSAAATERLAGQVDRAVAQGATLVSGGQHDGNFFSPTLLSGVTPENDTYYEEFFGPVASVYSVSSEDEAVELANDTPYGLGAYVMSNDHSQALRVADRIDAGMVYINVVGADGVELPFGGVKNSGFGRELGRYGIDEFVNKKLIRVG